MAISRLAIEPLLQHRIGMAANTTSANLACHRTAFDYVVNTSCFSGFWRQIAYLISWACKNYIWYAFTGGDVCM